MCRQHIIPILKLEHSPWMWGIERVHFSIINVFLPGSETNNRGCRRDGVCGGAAAAAAADIAGEGRLGLLAGTPASPPQIVYIFAMRNGDCRSTRLKWEHQKMDL